MNFNEKPKQPLTLENLSEIYRKKLDDILYMELIVENIRVFAKIAEQSLIKLNDEILKQYSTNPLFEANESLSIKEQEDDAYEKLGLPNLQDILKLIIDKIEQIKELELSLHTQINFSEKIITPPQPDKVTIEPGNGTFAEKQRLPRLLTLIYILNNDLQISLDSMDIVEGQVKPEMMRKLPYYRVTVQDLERLIYVCDEEGNASFIFDLKKLTELNLNIENIDVNAKEEINELFDQHPGLGIKVSQSKHWRDIMQGLLTRPMPEKFDQPEFERKLVYRKKRTEFAFLDYLDFQTEVRKIYQEQNQPNAIHEWYIKECANQPHWSTRPDALYKRKGWQDWYALVGRDRNPTKEYIPFSQFKTEVRAAYDKEKRQQKIHLWYRRERVNHPEWPARPDQVYAELDWQGFRELVGSEFLDYPKFVSEVQELYNAQGRPDDWRSWYKAQLETHPKWPSRPNYVYKDAGWKNYMTLLGRKVPVKYNITIEELQREVEQIYKERGNPPDIAEWYLDEQKLHANWPVSPDKKFKQIGWENWPNLVGKEKNIFLNYQDFKNEVKKIYETELVKPTDIRTWYEQACIKHKDWPRRPSVKYKGQGWTGWKALIK